MMQARRDSPGGTQEPARDRGHRVGVAADAHCSVRACCRCWQAKVRASRSSAGTGVVAIACQAACRAITVKLLLLNRGAASGDSASSIQWIHASPRRSAEMIDRTARLLAPEVSRGRSVPWPKLAGSMSSLEDRLDDLVAGDALTRSTGAASFNAQTLEPRFRPTLFSPQAAQMSEEALPSG